MSINNFEPSHLDTPVNYTFSMKNADDHDRLMVDPAYRMEQLEIFAKKNKVTDEYMEAIQAAIDKQHGKAPAEMSKETYMNLIEADIAIQELDQHFKNVNRFNIRHFLSGDKHEAREKKMRERSIQRTQNSETLYLGASETEMQYRDYFESDDEAMTALGSSRALGKSQALSDQDYKMEKYQFQEIITHKKERDYSSFLDKKIFRFNYRQAFFSPEDHMRKENRMLTKMIESGFNEKIQLMAQQNSDHAARGEESKIDKNEYYSLVLDQAIQNYKNYFESDLEEDFEYVENLHPSEKLDFMSLIPENGLYMGNADEIATVSGPRMDNLEEGFVEGSFAIWEQMKDMQNFAGSEMNKINMQKEMMDQAKADALKALSQKK